MKKRILSLVLCAAMLLSMCLFLGAGVMDDTTADGSAETTESYIPAVNFTNVAPFVQANAQAANGPARAPLRASANDGSTTPPDPAKDKDNEGLVTTKTAEAIGDGEYKITLTSYTTGTVTEKTTTKPTDIVLVLDQSGSMAYDMGSEKVTVYTKVESWNSTNYYNYYYQTNRYVKLSNGEYAKVTITESKSGGRWDTTYTYTYTDENNKQQSMTSEGPYTTFDEWQLYFQETRVLSRLEALQNAVTNFVNQVSKEARENNVDHRIAIVGFSSDGYDNTEILTGCTIKQGSPYASGTYDFPTGYNMNGVQKDDATPTNYQNALVDMRTEDGKTSATNAINALTAYGGTETNMGMKMAEQIFANDAQKDAKNRNRVVVLFTDGVPGHNSNDDTQKINTNYANPAIKCANDISTDYSATIYTVGIFGGANGENPQSLPANGKWYPSVGNNVDPISSTANRFMHLVSSNYPDATDMATPGNVNSSLKNGDSYYLSAGDADTLNNIFKKISDNISTPSINLGKQAYVQDTVSDYFTAPVGGTVTVATEKAYYENGNLQWKEDNNPPTGLEPTVTGKTVKVSGFDYDSNFVSGADKGRDESNQKNPGNFYGRRLVVTFTVKAEPGFLGGNNVPTNTSDSGVYDENEALVENFDYPRVNVPINTPELTSKGANVYYGGTVPTAKELCTTGAIGEKMDDYVNITYSVEGTVTNTTDDTYQVTMTVSPIYNGEKADGEPATEKTASVKSKVNVYKPEITFKDSIIDYNATPDYATDNLGEVVWKHGNEEAANMTGTAPTLTYTYDPEASAFTQDTGVKVTVSANGKELPKDVVTFRHDPCTFPGCKYTDDCGYQFYVHIKVFDLTIEKTGENIDQNQTFVFRVKGNNNDVDMQVVITGTNKQVIKNLPMGSYTITEDTNWSWKYTPVDGDEKTLTTSKIKNGAATVTFENENNGTNWLTSLAKALNKWTKDGTTVTRDPKN